MKRALLVLLASFLAVTAWFETAFARPELSYAARRGRVTVFAERGLDSTARELAESAEATLTRISGDLIGLSTPRAIEVRLVRDSSTLGAIAPAGRGAPAWAIGVAYPDLGVISVAMRRGAQLVDPGATLRHELAHVALGAALGNRAPHWLHEGFAYQHSAEWSWQRAETLAGMAWFGSVIPLEELDASFPREELPAHRAYAESYDFVGYLSRRGRYEDQSDDGDRWPFRRFLGELGRGSDPDAAARRAFGRSLAELFEEWKVDLGNRFMMMPVGLLGLGLWVLCAILLVFAWARRRRQNRHRLALWDLEEVARRTREEAARVTIPPYVAWPGEDPLAEDPDDDQPPGPPGRPRLMN
ncbi:MAG: hypothetical protein M3680_34255 [Myxococcota bacterium]|nr:hypothetical protein [Myxococcota bacterium]